MHLIIGLTLLGLFIMLALFLAQVAIALLIATISLPIAIIVTIFEWVKKTLKKDKGADSI